MGDSEHGGGDGKPAEMPSEPDHHGGDPTKSLLGSGHQKPTNDTAERKK